MGSGLGHQLRCKGRGHLILSGNHTVSSDAVFIGQADWWKGTTLVQNPAYTAGGSQPLFIHQDHVGNIQVTQGGLITGNSAGGAGSTLAANACAARSSASMARSRPFNFGTVYGNGCYNGCSADERTNALRFSPLAVPYRHSTIFGYASYQLTDDIKASLQLNYGMSSERSLGGLPPVPPGGPSRQCLSRPVDRGAVRHPVQRLQCRHRHARHRGGARPSR